MQAYIPPSTFGNMESPKTIPHISALSYFKSTGVSGNYAPKKVYQGRDISPKTDNLRINPVGDLYKSPVSSQSRLKQSTDPLYKMLLPYSLN